MGRQIGLHLAELDPKATNLDLIIGATNELELAVRPSAHEVPGAIHLRSRNVAEGVANEPLRGKLRAVQVTAGHPAPTDVQFSDAARGDRLSVLVEDIDLGPGDRPPNRRQRGPAAGRRNEARGRDHGGFRRPIIVDHRERQRRRRITVQRVSTGEQDAKRSLWRPVQRHQGLGHRGGKEGDRDPLRHQPVTQQPGIHAGVLIGDVDARPGGQVWPEFPDRRIERRAGHLRRSVGRRHGECALMPANQVQEIVMGDQHTLWLAG